MSEGAYLQKMYKQTPKCFLWSVLSSSLARSGVDLSPLRSVAQCRPVGTGSDRITTNSAVTQVSPFVINKFFPFWKITKKKKQTKRKTQWPVMQNRPCSYIPKTIIILHYELILAASYNAG